MNFMTAHRLPGSRNEMPANCRKLKQRLETLPSRAAA